MSDLREGDLGELPPIDPHHPRQVARRHLRNEAGERPHERRLPAAGGSAHEREGARPGGQVDAIERVDPLPRQRVDVGEGQAVDIDHGRTPR